MQETIGILIPFIGTTLGAAMVFLMKKEINRRIEKLLLGFASGVMIAASVWSLLIPSIEMAREQEQIAWIPASVGFLLGIIFLLVLDRIINKIKKEEKTSKNNSMMVLAVTLHNIPEGMAVGVAFAGAIMGNAGITLGSAIALAIGIGIQNFPEGAIISMPLKNEGMSKIKAFICGTLSGIVEPIAAVFTILLTNIVVPILPYFLSFAARSNDICCGRRINTRGTRRQTHRNWNNRSGIRIYNNDDIRCCIWLKFIGKCYENVKKILHFSNIFYYY